MVLLIHASRNTYRRNREGGRSADNFKKVMPEGHNPKKKHLLHRLVKKVLINSRQTFEAWYGLPSSQRFADGTLWLPGQDSNLQPSG